MAANLSPVDAAWLRMEDPTNLMMVTGLLVFDERLDVRRFRRTIETRLLALPRFRQRVRESPLGIGPPRWEEDENFDLDTHLHRVALPAPGNQTALQALVGDLMSTPLDLSTAPWQLHLVEGLRGGGSAVLVRIHHCIADGIALVRVLLSLTDATARARKFSPPAAPGAGERPFGPALAQLAGLVTDPLRALEMAGSAATAATTLRGLVTLPADPPTVLKGRLGVGKRTAWSGNLSLDAIREAVRRYDATFNDVVVATVAGALRRYLAGRGEELTGLEVRAAVPVNLRSLEGPIELGNRFGLVFVPLPVGLGDAQERLAEVKRRMDEIKGSAEAIVAFGVLNLLGLVPARLHGNLVEFFGGKASVVLTTSPGRANPSTWPEAGSPT